MAKVISLSDAAYGEIKALKQGDDSFSDVVLRLVEKVKRRPLKDFFGKWPGKTEEAEEIKRKLEKDRKHFALHGVRF